VLIETLQDNFNDGVIGPEWGNSYGGVTETGGRARVPCAAGTYAGYQSGWAYTLAGSSMYCKVPTRPAASTATEAYCVVQVTSSVTAGTAVGFHLDSVTGMLRMQSNVDYWDDTAVEITYDPVAHLWVRLRETSGTLSWDTSPDGTTWTNRRTLATPAWVSTETDTQILDLFAYRDTGTTDYAEYDQVNTLDNGAVYDAATTLAAAASLTAAGTLAVTVTATLTGSSTLAAPTTQTAVATATLAATANLTATSLGAIPEEVIGLSAGDCDLYIEQGATFNWTFASSADDGTPFSWAGWTARAQIRTSATPGAELLLDLAPYLTVDGAAITLAIPADVTTTLARSGRWDLELVQGSTVIRLLQGAATLSPEVTR
jgi:hypothetical protein